MINSKYLATYFTDLLNKAGKDVNKNFKIFADEGELKQAVKEYGKKPKEFTNGIVEILSSTLTPIRGIRLDTYTIQLTMFIDLAMDGFNEDKESLNLITLRDVFTKVIEENNGKTEFVKIEGVSYSQSMIIGYPTNGTKADIGYISDCLPIYWTFNIAMFEDGVNANDCKLIVNNIEIPFTRMVLTRQKTPEQNNFSGDSSTKTVMLMNGLSIDIVMPALKNNYVSDLIMKDVLMGGNYALSVRIETPAIDTMFIGTLGNTQASFDVAANVGYNLSIVESKENLLGYEFKGSGWNTMEIDTVISNIKEISFNSKASVYWGDGTYDYLEDGGTITHTYTDGKPKHTIRYFVGG